MKKNATVILTYIMLITFLISSILITILKTSTKKVIYENYYLTNNTAESLNIEYSNLINYTENIFKYFNNKEKLDNSWFTKKDILHMIDVKFIYNFTYITSIILIIISLISLILLIMLNKKDTLKIITSNYNTVFMFFIIIIVVITIIILYNFNYFWIKFHELIFTNDLWLLSPNESNLIKMFPEEFFFLLVKKIVLNILILLISLTIINNIVKIFLGRKDKYGRSQKK